MHLLERLRSQGWHDILVINDQSTDATGEIARASGANVSQPRPADRRLGRDASWHFLCPTAGVSSGYHHGPQMVNTVDEIPVLLQARASADLIVGAFPERASPLRQMAWNWFRRLAGFDLRPDLWLSTSTTAKSWKRC